MNQMNCPHCESENIVPDHVPSGVVAVMPCPQCSQLLVRFRDKMIGLDKEILMNGSKEERTFHLAEVIAEFMDEGDFNFDSLSPSMMGEALSSHGFEKDTGDDEIEVVDVNQNHPQDKLDPISDEEAQRFINFELNAIDNMDYFKRHLE